MQKLGRNKTGYVGERIEIRRVLAEVVALAQRHRWCIERLPAGATELLALRRGATDAPRRIYLSAGIHGDEPAGPLAARALLERNAWPEDAAVWLCPCLNPTGFPLNTRASADGLDLNRDYRQPQSLEIRAHTAWLRSQPDFDFALCLHEDWESHGFYLFELNPDGQPSHAARMIEAVLEVCPCDRSEIIDHFPASGGVIHPSIIPAERPDWPEAFFLIQHKTRLSYTLEAPSDFDLPVRVEALVRAVEESWKS